MGLTRRHRHRCVTRGHGGTHDAGVAVHVAEGCGHQLKLGATIPALVPATLTMAAHREESRRRRHLKSHPHMRRAPKPAHCFSCLTLCQTAMAIALFSSCRGPSPALFTGRWI